MFHRFHLFLSLSSSIFTADVADAFVTFLPQAAVNVQELTKRAKQLPSSPLSTSTTAYSAPCHPLTLLASLSGPSASPSVSALHVTTTSDIASNIGGNNNDDVQLQITTELTPTQIAELATTPCNKQNKSGDWVEIVPSGETYTRFVVQGEGSITMTNATTGSSTRKRIGPGCLVKARGECQLLWDVDVGEEMVILYSGEMPEEAMVAIGLGWLAGACGLIYLGLGVQ